MSQKQNDDGRFVQLRDQRNQDILKRMNEGDPLTSYDGSSSWFPPRPIIEKNTQEMARVYDSAGSTAIKPKTDEKEVVRKKHFIRLIK